MVVRKKETPVVQEATQKTYRIKPGVAWVNGQRVGKEKTVSLTEAEAAYSLGIGHIYPADKPEPAEWAKKADKAEKADGGD